MPAVANLRVALLLFPSCALSPQQTTVATTTRQHKLLHNNITQSLPLQPHKPQEQDTTSLPPPIMATTMHYLSVLGTLLALAAVAPTLAAVNIKTNTLPPACLRDATALCQGTTTNSLTCIMQLAKAGDIRVSKACSTALPAAPRMAASDTRPVSPVAGRVAALQRLLGEGGPGSTTNCAAGTAQATLTVTTGSDVDYFGQAYCTQVCCKFSGAATAACCQQFGNSAFCLGGDKSACA